MIRKLFSNLPSMLRDAVGLAGCASVSYGIWLIFEPAEFIALGALPMVGTMLSARSVGR